MVGVRLAAAAAATPFVFVAAAPVYAAILWQILVCIGRGLLVDS
jgi:hypothetical protein